MTHAFFKALLFLGAGSVIHALGDEQDLRNMGGLRRHTPVTFATMLVGAAAIAGLFPFAGFFSKDEILWSAWHSGHPAVWAIGLATAGLTAFYMFRLIFLAFFGEERIGAEARHHLHESPPSMTLPLAALALLSTAGGWVGLPAWLGANRFEHFLEPSLRLAVRPGHAESAPGASLLFAVVAVVVAIAGIAVAYGLYVARPLLPAAPPGGWHRLLARKYYVDEIYDALVVHPVERFSRALWRGFDAAVIDGSVNGVGRSLTAVADRLKLLQSGLTRGYASWILLGAVAVLLYVFSQSRG
jgi:NADH-quinone oxidoreductase subunit L